VLSKKDFQKNYKEEYFGIFILFKNNK